MLSEVEARLLAEVAEWGCGAASWSGAGCLDGYEPRLSSE